MRRGKRRTAPGRIRAGAGALALSLLVPAAAEARCGPGWVRGPSPRRARAVSFARGGRGPGGVSLEWFGHAYFRLISPAGIRALTDPFSAARGYPIPRTRPHLVTIGKHSTNHSGLEIVGGEPAVLDGLRKDTYDGMRVRKTVGDLTVFNVPTAISGFDDDEKGSAFVFETGGLCIAHLGDIVAPLNASQLRRLGRVHVALVVLSGFVSMGPEAAAEFIRRKLRPNIVIPMHYYDDEETLARFAGRFRRVRRLKTNRLLLRRRALPPPTEVVILRHP